MPRARIDREPSASPYRAHLDALIRPLRSEAGESGGPARRVENLASAIAAANARLQGLSIPQDLKARLANLAGRFGKNLEGEARRKAVTVSLRELEVMSTPRYTDDLLMRPVSSLPGVGPKRAESLSSRGLRNLSDLLFHLPVRYDDRRALARVGDLEVGRHATFIARVQQVELSSSPQRGGRFRKILQVIVGDETGSISLKWFRGGSSIQQKLPPGTRILVTGDVKRFRFTKEIVHPEMEILDLESGPEAGSDSEELERLRSVVPAYPMIEGVHPRTLRRLVADAVRGISDLLEGYLPVELVRERGLPSVAESLRRVHDPDLDAELESLVSFGSAAHERLILEELHLLELGLLLRRDAQAARPGTPIPVASERVCSAPEALPFRLTGAQARVWEEIRKDLGRPHPMNRLLQGDVGCGKTAIALLAAVAVAEGGKQTALMAPTELLAEQHFRSLRKLVECTGDSIGLRLGLLTGSQSRAESEATLKALAQGEIDLLIGTHALIQENVVFASLALAIVDEQHRFGVLQRAVLGERAESEESPHVLVMTATPIPRTLALTVYGDLDLSVIDEMPPGRTPVETVAVAEGEGERIMGWIIETLERGEQVYVVYPLIEESEKVDLRSAIDSAGRIAKAFPETRVDLLHGRLDAAERRSVMDRFEKRETQILVATTVIEVGIDVPNATLMIIEHAERFGLAQLHQLRGRVGRGEQAGRCILVARGGGEEARARLDAMVSSRDGFEIAEADLRIRGPGEFLGTRQSGHPFDLRLADLARDARLVSVARECAHRELELDPGLVRNPRMREAVEAHWGERLALARVG